MITTVTLNTSIDRRYLLEDFSKGSIYRSKRYQATAGGKGLNVTKVIRDLGEAVTAAGFIGGFNGKFIKNQLDLQGIMSDFVEIEEETRSCIAILSSDGSQTEILESGPEVSPEELDRFMDKFHSLCDKSSLITISGSLPTGVPEDTYGSLIRAAGEKKVKVILDTSGRSLECAIDAHPYLIKPNEEELTALLNRTVTSQEDIIGAGKRLLEMGIENIVVSLGKAGAMLFNDGFMYKAEIPEIKAVNPVGSGDSMVAGLAVGITRGYSPEDMLKLGAACGTANAMEEETGKVKPENVNSILEKIKVTKTRL